MVYFDEFFERFFRSINRLIREMEREFGELERSFREIPEFEFRGLPLPRLGEFGYRIEERPEGYIVRIPMPGVDKKDIDLRVDEERNVIIVKAESKLEEAKEEEGIFRGMAFNYYFEIPIPRDANKEAIIAKYKDGMLLIFIPKLKPEKKEEKVRRIEIE